MNNNHLKEQISNSSELSEKEKFKVLSSILTLFVNRKTESLGREFTIRVLEQFKHYSDFSMLIRSMVRKAGLFPYLKSEFNVLTLNEELLLSSYKPINRPDDFIFHSLQKKVYSYLLDKKNVVLSASTSVGKSAIVDSLVYSRKFKKIVIIVPTIALIDETRRRLSNLVGADFQVISHGSQKAHSKNLIYVLTQERVLEREDLESIDLLILDEFYKLNIDSDSDFRAITLNLAFSFLMKNSKQFYLIGPNIKSITGLSFLNKNYIFLSSDFSTVALNIHEHNLPLDSDVRTAKVIDLLTSDDACTLIYCQSPQSTVRLANELILSNKLKASVVKSNVADSFIEWINENYHYNWIVSKALRNGIGIHHGALPRAIQQEMIKLFNSGKIKVLLCTSTIIEGVNTSAKNVIIYDRRNANPVVSMFTYKNIQGRAGRMGRYFVGNVHCLEKRPEESDDDSDVVVASGVQSIDSPLNLLCGLDNEILTEDSRDRLRNFQENNLIPFEIFKRNTKYHPGLISDLASFIQVRMNNGWSDVMWSGMPNRSQTYFLCDCILILESRSLGRARLSNIDDLVPVIIQYLNSGSYSDFVKSKIEYYEYKSDISDTIDWLLAFLRNSIGHNIPYAISLTSQLIGFLCSFYGYKDTHDYGLVMHKMENYHLPGVYSALDEFGVPIQVVEKIVGNSPSELDLDALLSEIKGRQYQDLKAIERYFLRNLS
ncbi:TPA: DEAD/DEAH box helicase [Serratia marcescens]|uniref:helicase-related protein n=1 Tax=Serratia bockelmannii TaxID=2703793 RepID=UPI0018D6FF01|nr:helicase-related protein [Serratia bockelmannii]MBH3105303.1 DEAD/DEAH box helicase [Serratia marcescens]MCW7609513.1 helicase-related protein [Serratia bockelmannii]HAV5985080.1 DEAD/DEAH box helicase [Serratia marcescens]